MQKYLLLYAFLTLFFINYSYAQTWTGGGDGVTWTDVLNWDTGVPASNGTATFNTAVTVDPAGAIIGALVIDATGSLTLTGDLTVNASNSPTNSVTVTGCLINSAGATLAITTASRGIQIPADDSKVSNFGCIAFDGNDDQTININGTLTNGQCGKIDLDQGNIRVNTDVSILTNNGFIETTSAAGLFNTKRRGTATNNAFYNSPVVWPAISTTMPNVVTFTDNGINVNNNNPSFTDCNAINLNQAYDWFSVPSGQSAANQVGSNTADASGAGVFTFTGTSTGTSQTIYTCFGSEFSATITVPNTGLAVSDPTICSGDGAEITVSSSVSGFSYQLRLDTDDSNQGTAVNGTGSDIILTATPSPTTTTTYNVLVTDMTSNCTAELMDKALVTVIALPAAPTSGGDQTVCAASPVQTITATATAPSGSSIDWYDAASAGNVVLSPTRNAVGTITYYAESVTTTGSCSSASRTPVTLTINALPSAPTISRDNDDCTYSYVPANAGDTFSPATIPTAAPGSDPSPFSVVVTNAAGCTASFTIDPEACPMAAASFTVDNTFKANDPCTCRGDQVLNTNGTIVTPGTFDETVTVTGPPGFFLQITSATGIIGGAFPLSLTDPTTSGNYAVTFRHEDRVGYNITAFEFSLTGTPGSYMPIAGLTISNVCAYPQVACATPLPATMDITDAPIALGVNTNPLNMAVPAFSNLAGFPEVRVNNVPTTTFNPAASPAISGNNTIEITYDIASGMGRGGTVGTPAIPLANNTVGEVCPVSIIKTITVADPIPTMSQWGLMIFGLLILNLGLMLLYRKERVLQVIK